MASPPTSPPPPPPPSPPPPSDTSASSSAVKRTRKASLVHVDPTIGKADSPHRKKLRIYLGIVERDKVDITYKSWKEAEFEIPEASDSRMKRKLSARDEGSLNQTSRGNGPLQLIRTVWMTLFARLAETLLGRMCRKRHRQSRNRTLPPTFCLVGKLLTEKTRKKLEEDAQSGSVDDVIDPPSPVRRHMKSKMVRTKKTGEMTTEAAKEITEKIGSFVPRGHQDVLTVAIGRPEHPGRVRATGSGVTIKKYFGSVPWTSHSSSLLPPEELQQLT
ncbi:hypothetical protein GmHk_03G007417 [Glycine max]|nr:hypothetical protein GmHk_03G007417 [Glycine max]